MDLGVIFFIVSNVLFCLNLFIFDLDMLLNINYIIFVLKVKFLGIWLLLVCFLLVFFMFERF